MYSHFLTRTRTLTVVKEPKLLDITYSAGVEKLDDQEKEVCPLLLSSSLLTCSLFCAQLCSYCRFQPEAYLQFKRQMIAECQKCGKLSLAESRRLLKIDVNKTRKVFDHLLAKGLIHTNSATT